MVASYASLEPQSHQPPTGALLLVGFLLFLLLAAPMLAAPGAPTAGLVVEKVPAGSAPVLAGIQTGDVLLSWQPLDTTTPTPDTPGPVGETVPPVPLASPFDLEEVELEHSWHGVELHGERGGRARTWQLPAGSWQLSVRPPLKPEHLDAYLRGSAAFDAGEPAQGTELWRDLAERLSTDGQSLAAAWLYLRLADALSPEGDWDELNAHFTRALQEAHDAGSSVAPLHVLTAHGRAAEARGLLDVAAKYYELLLDARRHLDSPHPDSANLGVAVALHHLGIIAGRRQDWTRANALFEQVRQLQERLAPDSLALANTYNSLAIVARHRGDTEIAAAFLQRDLAITERLAPESLDLAATLSNLGLVRQQEGDLEAAQALLLRALDLRRRLQPEGRQLPLSLINLGTLAINRGDLLRAERHCREALEETEAIEAFEDLAADALSCLGAIAFERGALDLAEQRHHRALEIYRRRMAASPSVAISLNNLAGVAFRRGDMLQAERYQSRSLALTAKYANGSPDHAIDLDNMGWIALHRGEPQRAEELFRQALAIHQQHGDTQGLGTAQSLYLLGMALAAMVLERPAEHDPNAAIEALEQALDIHQRLVPEAKETADSAFQLARLQRQRGQPTLALALLRQALDTLDGQQLLLGGSAQEHSLFATDFASVYHEALDLLVELGHHEEAFHVLERYRAHGLLHLLQQRSSSLNANIPPALLRQRRLADTDYDRLYRQLIDTPKDDQQDTQLIDALRKARLRQEDIASQIRAAVPRLSQLQPSRVLDLEAARSALAPGTLLLSYAISDTGCFLFAVNSGTDDFAVFELDTSAEELETAVQRLREAITLGKANPRTRRLDFQARHLSRLLLAPAAAQLERADRLLILPDGPLHKLPFATLPDPANETAYLVESKSLHIAASVTVLVQLTHAGTAQRPARILALGDTLASPEVPALPASRAEVEALGQLYPEASQIFLGAEATEARVKTLAGTATLIHLACHALLDDHSPFESALVLSPPQSAPPGGTADEAQENGLLQVWEIFEQLRLDADLVTLSACETATGREAGGEGLVGLSYAFQYAGARSVLATLWPISDASTAKLMHRFYTYLRDGESKAGALRRAQVDLLHDPASAHPFHWAGFRLIGDGG